jgi:hypothetical protein
MDELKCQKEAYAFGLQAREDLNYLLQSETIRLVYQGDFLPKDLDSTLKNLRKRVAELEHRHIMDMEQIAAQRRQIDLLMEIK